ncbi:MAG: CAP domain-containing protein [Armatimonadetes bacterium]|nr:CAP domain-containing protein [Armatimonadota bacterium]
MTKLSLYLASMLLGSNFSATTPMIQPPAHVSQIQVAAAETQLLDSLNAERWDRGLSILSENPLLVEVARAHSREMYEKSYFDHVSPTPGLKTPMARYLKALGSTPAWACVGENLFYCSIVDVERGHLAFMKSPRHRENILNPRFEQVGIGVYISPDGQFFVTQVFLAQVD